MSDHLGSYRRTMLIALAVMLVCIACAIAWLVSAGAIIHPAFLVDVADLPLLLIAIVGGLTALGAMISLHRDSLETHNKPYFAQRPRERQPGILTRARRRLLGTLPGSSGKLSLRPGEWVIVRPLTEIAATLDSERRLDGLPFMAEMARFCGERHRVFRRVERIHNYFDPQGAHLRRMQDAVLLDELRCTGDAHGGCQAACQIIWKEAWLMPAGERQPDQRPFATSDEAEFDKLVTKSRVEGPGGEIRYVCQMTSLPGATTRARFNDPRHYLRDVWSGNVRFSVFLTAVAINLFNLVQRRTGGAVAPFRVHDAPKISNVEPLNLQPGERVRVKSKAEIERTLINSKNRGLWFDIEMHRFCGGEFRVASRVTTLVDEGTGRLLTIKNPCIVLDGVSATGEYLALCPQNELIYWREAWLERLDPRTDSAIAAAERQAV
jgi:hypothetical protein